MRFDKNGRSVPDPACPYQPGGGVLCNLDIDTPERCRKCGWNPRVSFSRKRKLRERLGLEMEVDNEPDSDPV